MADRIWWWLGGLKERRESRKIHKKGRIQEKIGTLRHDLKSIKSLKKTGNRIHFNFQWLFISFYIYTTEVLKQKFSYVWSQKNGVGAWEVGGIGEGGEGEGAGIDM